LKFFDTARPDVSRITVEIFAGYTCMHTIAISSAQS